MRMGKRRLGRLGWNERVRICMRKSAGLGGTRSISLAASTSVKSFIILILVAIRSILIYVRSSRAISRRVGQAKYANVSGKVNDKKW